MKERSSTPLISLNEARALLAEQPDGERKLRAALEAGILKTHRPIRRGRKAAGLWFMRSKIVALSHVGVVLSTEDRADRIWYLRRARWTFKQIGARFGITKDRARQIYAREVRRELRHEAQGLPTRGAPDGR